MYVAIASLLVAGLVLAPTATAQDSDQAPSSISGEHQLPVKDFGEAPSSAVRPRPPAQYTDPRIYGAVPVAARRAESPGTDQYTPPTPVPVADAFKGSKLSHEGEANQQVSRREATSALSSTQAGVSLLTSTLAGPRQPTLSSDPRFDAAEFLRTSVGFQLDLTDERFMLEAQSEEEAQYRLKTLQDRHRGSAVWQQNAPLIKSISGTGIAVVLLLWWWLSPGSRTKSQVTAWTVRGLILAGSFYLHWAFGLFMLLGLYTHLTRSHGR